MCCDQIYAIQRKRIEREQQIGTYFWKIMFHLSLAHQRLMTSWLTMQKTLMLWCLCTIWLNTAIIQRHPAVYEIIREAKYATIQMIIMLQTITQLSQNLLNERQVIQEVLIILVKG